MDTCVYIYIYIYIYIERERERERERESKRFSYYESLSKKISHIYVPYALYMRSRVYHRTNLSCYTKQLFLD